MIKKLIEKSKGITLIALVVTIVVLLILAGVTLSIVIGNNGIFEKANEAVIASENAEVYDQLKLKTLDYTLDNLSLSEPKIILEKLLEEGYIDENNIINVSLLMGRDMKTGNGNIENGDIYFLQKDENEEKIYNLIYCNENKEYNNLGKAFKNSSLEDYLEPTSEEYFDFDETTGSIALKDAESYYYTGTERTLGLKTLVIPSTYNGKEVKKIGILPSEGISYLKDVETIVIPSTVEEIEIFAFRGCTGLKNVVIPESIKTIKSGAFGNCTKLEKVEIPKGVETVETSIFYGCSLLKTITVHFKEGQLPSGWNSNWNANVNAQVVYEQ